MLFGPRRGPAPFIDIPMPGVISGYGGGTWNMDGTPVTPGPGVIPKTDPALASPTPSPGGGMFGGGKKRGFGNVLADALMYYSAARGSPIGIAGVQAKQKRLDAEREYEKEQRQLAPVYAAIDADPNMTPQEKALAKGNPKAYLESWAQQFGTRVVNKGDTVQRGLGGGRSDTYMAPQVSEVGNELILTDPQNRLGRNGAPAPSPAPMGATPSLLAPADAPAAIPPMSMPIYRGRSEMENYASQFGEPGSPEWRKAIQDFRLRGAGPTAYIYKDQLQDQRLDQSNTNNVRTTGTSRDNNIRTTGTSRDNSIRSNETSTNNNIRTNQTRVQTSRGGMRGGGGGPPEGSKIRNPQTGQVAVMKGGRWVDEKSGQPIR